MNSSTQPAFDGRSQPIHAGDTIITHILRWSALYVAKVADTKGQQVKLGDVQVAGDSLCDLKAGVWIPANECLIVNEPPHVDGGVNT